jgi:hypothetical protein
MIGALCRRSDVLMALLQQHLDAFDTLLPHLVVADVERWAEEQFQRDPRDATLRDVLEFLEVEFARTGFEDHELIAASFIETSPAARRTR